MVAHYMERNARSNTVHLRSDEGLVRQGSWSVSNRSEIPSIRLLEMMRMEEKYCPYCGRPMKKTRKRKSRKRSKAMKERWAKKKKKEM